MNRSSLLLLFTLVCVGLPQSAPTWDAAVPLSEGVQSATVQPIRVAASEDGGYWVHGNSAVGPLLMRFDPQDQLLATQYGSTPGDRLLGLAGAAALAFGGGVQTDRLQRFDADGARRWSSTTQSPVLANPREAQDGAIWVTRSAQPAGPAIELLRLDAAGVARSMVDQPARAFTGRSPVAVSSTAGQAYWAGFAGWNLNNAAEARAEVLKLGPEGDLVWRFAAAANLGPSVYTRVLEAADGSVRAAGQIDALIDNFLIVTALSHSGTQIWTRSFPEFSGAPLRGHEIDPNGELRILVADRAGSADRLLSIEADGDLRWAASLPPGYRCAVLKDDVRCPLFVRNDGTAVLVVGSPSLGLRALRYSPAGQVVGDTPLGNFTLEDAGLLSNGDLLLVLWDGTAEGRRLQRVGANGLVRTLLGPGATQTQSVRRTSTLDAILDEAGGAYLVTGSSANDQLLTRVSAGGQRLWQRPLAPQFPGLLRSQWFFAGTQLCRYAQQGAGTTFEMRLECVDRASGSPRFSRAGSGSGMVLDPELGLLVGERLLWVESTASGSRLTLFNLDGSVFSTRDSAVAGGSLRIFPSIGDGFLLYTTPQIGQPGTTLRAFELDGSPRAQVTLQDTPLLVQPLQDGGFVSVYQRQASPATGTANVRLSRFDRRAQRQFDVAISDRFVTQVEAGESLDQLLLVLRNERQTGVSRPDNAQILGVSLANGTLGWRSTLGAWTGQPSRLLRFPDRRRLLYVAQRPGGLLTYRLDPPTERVLLSRMLPCQREDCPLQGLRLASNEDLLAHAAARDPLLGADQRLLRWQQPLQLPNVSPANQSALAGAWYAPYAGGQGLLMTYFPQQSGYLAAWFTYAPEGTAASGKPALRWFTLQGLVGNPATSVDFQILESANGRFATAPVVAASPVGRASLRFDDCDRATLSYAFDSDQQGGAHGVVDLSRLTPSTLPCRRADGSTQPPALSPPPNGGLDLRQSGTWYAPTSSGQGVQLYVVPEAASNPGFVFGAWFTFDPDSEVDDPAKQDWLTLQALVSNVSDGRVRVAILRTVGGGLDAVPTRNTVPIGEATLSFTACDRMTLDYSFVDSRVAGGHRGRSGSVALQRLDPCLP